MTRNYNISDSGEKKWMRYILRQNFRDADMSVLILLGYSTAAKPYSIKGNGQYRKPTKDFYCF